MTTMKWDSSLYDKQHHFVSEYGQSLVELVNTEPGQCIWDLGCGTGILSDQLARQGAHVTGTDLSPEMIRQAKDRYPHIDFRVADAVTVSFDEPFDTVFSNAVFHWIKDQENLLANVHRALKPDGRIVCEMGAEGNISHIETAFRQSLASHGVDYKSQFFFPSTQQYASLLRQAGFTIEAIEDFDRPTPFPNGEEGMALWLTQFYAGQLNPLDKEVSHAVINQTVSILQSILWKNDTWIGDYRRLRFAAVRQ